MPTLAFVSQERFFDQVNIVLVGKYSDFKDSYTSVIKALEHSAFRVYRKLVLQVCKHSFPSCSFLTSWGKCCVSGLNRRIWSSKRRIPILLNIMMLGVL